MANDRLLTMDPWTSAFLISVALLLMAARAVMPVIRRPEGRTLRALPVPLRAKLRQQRLPLALLGLVIGADLVSGQIRLGLDLGAVAVACALLAMPARCVMTDRGIRAGWTPFRRWSEFAGLSVRRGNIRLQPLSGLAKLEITLPGRFEDADIVAEMRTLVRMGYQGAPQNDGGAESGEENGKPPLALA